MRPLSLLITAIAYTPILLIFGGWVYPLSDRGAKAWAHIRETVLLDYIRGSLLLVLCVAALSAIMGTMSAWFVARYDFPFRRTLSWLLILPFAIPSFILAMCYGQILEFAGPVQSSMRETFDLAKGEYFFPEIRSLGGAALLMALGTYPYVYLASKGAFESQSEDWSRLAEAYGHDQRWASFWLSLGAARPFITVGVLLCVMEAAADIGVTQLFGVPTLATGLYRIWYYGDEPLVAARVASFLVLIAATLLLGERLSRRRARFSTINQNAKTSRIKLSGASAWTASFFVALPFVLGFAIPLLWTIRMAFFNNQHIRLEKLIDATWDSLLLCIVGALVTIMAAFVLNLSERQSKGQFRLYGVATLGYAVPGIVIALSLLYIQKTIAEITGWRLIITGSILGLVIAYMIRFIAPAYQSIHSGFARITPEFDDLAESFGKTPIQTLTQIYLPLLRNPLVYAYLLVTIDILKELPASLLLRPFDITTHAIAVFEFAGDDRPAEAAPYALVLIAFGTLGVYIINRFQRGDRDSR